MNYSEKQTQQIYKVEKFGKSFTLVDTSGVAVGTLGVGSGHRKAAYASGHALKAIITSSGKKMYRKVDIEEYNKQLGQYLEAIDSAESTGSASDGINGIELHGEIKTHWDIVKFIHTEAVPLKPQYLVMAELKWKYLVRTVLRSKNILMTGMAGSGKTLAAKAVISALNRPAFYMNLGSSQDPRATLIGNTFFNKETGTYFSKSAFVKAIETPNSVILLDEISRAHPDAWNILMTVLDAGQRYLRLDEADGSPIINVADGVTFIGTANIGTEYTSTRVMDRALMDRFTIIEMDLLNDTEEFNLLRYMFPNVSHVSLKSLAEIAHHTRDQCLSSEGKLTNMVSTRASVEAADLLNDGFSLMEATEIAITPFFSPDGGLDSERTYVKQLIQKYITEDDSSTNLFGTSSLGEDSGSDVPLI